MFMSLNFVWFTRRRLKSRFGFDFGVLDDSLNGSHLIFNFS